MMSMPVTSDDPVDRKKVTNVHKKIKISNFLEGSRDSSIDGVSER